MHALSLLLSLLFLLSLSLLHMQSICHLSLHKISSLPPLSLSLLLFIPLALYYFLPRSSTQFRIFPLLPQTYFSPPLPCAQFTFSPLRLPYHTCTLTPSFCTPTTCLYLLLLSFSYNPFAELSILTLILIFPLLPTAPILLFAHPSVHPYILPSSSFSARPTFLPWSFTRAIKTQ